MKFNYVKHVTNEKLTLREAIYWKKVFMHNLMIGTEIEFESGNDASVRDINSIFPEKRSTINEFCSNGIESIKSDGSLRSGAEICTSGKRVYGFMEQFSLYKNIIDKVYRFKPLANSRAGWHNHIVLQNIGRCNAKEMPIPGIILSNTFSILKMFYPALAWIGSSLSGECYTRRSNFCKHDKLRNQSVNISTGALFDIFEERYSAINTTHLSLGEKGTVDTFHLEFRFPDVGLFPALMATENILFKAIILKAIEVSKHGLITTTEDNLIKIRDLYSFRNGGVDNITEELDKPYIDVVLSKKLQESELLDRESLPLTEEGLQKLKSLSLEMIKFLAPIIKEIDETALIMLNHFAKKPVSVMFKELKTDKIERINEALEEIIDSIYEKTDEEMLSILELIDNRTITNVDSEEEWLNKASDFISCKEGIDNKIKKLKRIAHVEFSKEFGYFVV